MSHAPVIETPASTDTKVMKKVPKVKKVKKPSTHPKYNVMIAQAIDALKEKSGSSRQAIIKYIVANFKVDEKAANIQVKFSLIRGVKSGSLTQMKGAGASGSFRLVKGNDKVKPKKPAKKAEKKTPKKKAAKKSAAGKKTSTKKRKAIKKSLAKKPAAKKASKPKKPAAKKAKK